MSNKPNLTANQLSQLKQMSPVVADTEDIKRQAADKDERLSENTFRWLMNDDAIATEKLAEWIRNVAIDQVKLEKQLTELLQK